MDENKTRLAVMYFWGSLSVISFYFFIESSVDIFIIGKDFEFQIIIKATVMLLAFGYFTKHYRGYRKPPLDWRMR